MDEVVQQFTARLGVGISVEIDVKSNTGFNKGLLRSVKGNCSALPKFGI